MAGQPALHARWLGCVPYAEAWALQRELAAQRRAGAIADQLLLLEHPPVYTMGRGGEARHLGEGPAALLAAGADYIEVDRGGSVTFHGPGQLVAYPIIRLAGVFPIAGHPAHGDVVRYVRALETATMATAGAFGVRTERRPPFTGVWSGTTKLAAIGVKLAGGVTQHGLALNVCTDLSWFDRVTPCGIDDATATSLHVMGVADVRPETVAPVLARELARVFGRRLDDTPLRARRSRPASARAAA